MDIGTALAIAAIIGSVFALSSEQHAAGAVALMVAGLELAISEGVVRLTVANLKLPLVLGAILVVAGGLIINRTSRKYAVAGAAVVFTVGLLQVLVALDIVGARG